LEHTVVFVRGEHISDWHLSDSFFGIWPYTQSKVAASTDIPCTLRLLWTWKSLLCTRRRFGTPMLARGLTWYEWQELYTAKLRSPTSISYSNVSTHNQFILDRGGKVFNAHAPVIKLDAAASEPDYIQILGILNSSTAGFWLRQVCHPKGTGGIGGGLATELWEQFFDFDNTPVSQLPLPADRPTELATAIQAAADERTTLLPANLIKSFTPTRERLDTARNRAASLLRRMIALQEELDWHVYHLYGLIDEFLTLPIADVPDIELGQRAFEIVMARDTELETAWFDRHGSTPHTNIPDHWPEPYRNLVQRRLDRIAADRDIALIEQPEYKRRWNLPKWDDLEKDALRSWLLDRLESETIWSRHEPELLSVERLAERVRHDTDFRSVAAIYSGREDYDLTSFVQELVLHEAVAFLPVLRYKDTGLRKHEQWKRTWDLQRREDKGEKIGEIPVPPKYKPEDFLPGPAWTLRGKLDVPKERFILYPGLERENDRTPVVAWAGFDHGEQARALAGYYQAMRADEGWQGDRLQPILAGLVELLPWLRQWHNTPDATGFNIAQTIDEFLRGELAEWSITEEDLKQWRPAQTTRARAPRRRRTEATGS
jgi:hypothetical protein